MKIKKLIFFCLSGLLIIVLLTGFHNYIIHRYVIVHAAMDEVAMQFTDLHKWTLWHPDFAHKVTRYKIETKNNQQEIVLPAVTYRLQVPNPAVALITKISQSNTTTASLMVTPYGNGAASYVEYTESVSGFQWLKRSISGNEEAAHLLKCLQLFAEDDSRRYGFLIRTVPVTDTLILTTRTKITNDSVIHYIPVMVHRLVEFCRQHAIDVPKDYYYVSTTSPDNKLTEIAAGIPVHKEAAPQPGFEFLKLPSGGKLIAGQYKGRYAGRQQLYDAMSKYMLYKRLKKVAQPLEQYRISDTSFTTGSYISLQLFYPVF